MPPGVVRFDVRAYLDQAATPPAAGVWRWDQSPPRMYRKRVFFHFATWRAVWLPKPTTTDNLAQTA